MGRRVGLTREQVLDAAVALADRKGFDQLTISGLARALRIRPPSLYNHVSGLREIQKELALRGADQMTTILREQLGQLDDPFEELRGLCHRFRAFAQEHRGLYEAYLHASSLAEDERELLRVREPLELLQSRFSVLALDSSMLIHLVRTFRGMVHGLIALEKDHFLRLPISVDETFDVAVDVFVAGVRATVGQDSSG